MKSGIVSRQVLAAGVVLVAVLVGTHVVDGRGGSDSEAPTVADVDGHFWPDVSQRLDLERSQARRLHPEIRRIGQRLEEGIISLPEATDQLQAAISSCYPGFIRSVRVGSFGRTDQARLAHLLVRFCLQGLGGPTAFPRAAEILDAYRRLYHPDQNALENLRLTTPGWPEPEASCCHVGQMSCW